MSFAVYSPVTPSVSDVRRLEIGQLMNALEALLLEGIIDRHEFLAKCRTLADWSHTDDSCRRIG